MSERSPLTTPSGSLIVERIPRPQTPACDACSHGVMDSTNPHLWGDCECACHGASERLTIREAFDLRYHVPRSQVWAGSRGRQVGNVHLHVKRGEAFQADRIRRVQHQALCGRSAWYDREIEGDEGQRKGDFCARCVEIGTRVSGRLSGLVTS